MKGDWLSQNKGEPKWLRVEADVRGAGTRDEPLRMSAWEARPGAPWAKKGWFRGGHSLVGLCAQMLCYECCLCIRFCTQSSQTYSM